MRHPNDVHDLNAQLQRSVEGITMQKSEPFDYVALGGSTLKPHEGYWIQKEDGIGAEDADSIAILDAPSPLGSELSSLPPLHLSHPALSSLDMSFLDSDLVEEAPHQPSCQLDSALEDYTQTWRQLVHGSSLLASSFFPQPHSAFSFDADPTPPLSFDFDLPAMTTEAAADAGEHSPAIEVVAPRPIRLANPAIHLAAVVEDLEGAASSSHSDDKEPGEEHETEDPIDSAVQTYGYSLEKLQEYMSDSESSCDEDDGDQGEGNFTPGLENFQFTYPTYHNISNPSIAQGYGLLTSSPLSALPPPDSPLSPTACTVPHTSRVLQLRDSVRDRRAARQSHHGHARHYSVPNVYYRPPNWNEARSETLAPSALRRHRTGNASHSVDWSVHAPSSIMLSLPDAYFPVEQYPADYAVDLQYRYLSAGRQHK